MCPHTFNSVLGNISNGGSWCPYCVNKKLCENKECQMCYERSFASHLKSKYWSNGNKLSPRQVFRSSHNKYWFICDRCPHKFKTVLHSISNGDRWCPYCHNKTETKLYDYLIKTYPSLQRQYKPAWCINQKTNQHLPFDFVIDEYKLIIELDGSQHFDQISNWDVPQTTQAKDKYKMLCAWNHGYSMIRLLQEEVLADTIELETKLLPLIHSYEIPHVYCVYQSNLGKHDVYSLFYEEYMLNPDITIDLQDDDVSSDDTIVSDTNV
jgi:very-short-patch-repair endonuclease